MSENRLDAKIDKLIHAQSRVGERLTRISLLVEQNTTDLKEHMARTAASEKRLDSIEKLKYYVIGGLIAASALSSSIREIALQLLINIQGH